jgi:hypothetical protein
VRNAAISRSVLIFMGITLVTTALVACSGGGDDDDNLPTVSPTIAATSTGEPTSGPTAPATATSPAGTPTYAPGVLIDGYIGEATMDADGTVSLALRAANPDGSIVYGYFDYPPDHANYQQILDHIGPIEPGETVNVLPFE